MTYTKQTWADNDRRYPVTAARMAHIEDGIYNVATAGTGGGAFNVGDGGIYVSKSGNDSNDGLSWSNAKLTIGAAITAAGAPITVFVGAGFYQEAVTLAYQGMKLIAVGPVGSPTNNTGVVIQAPNDSATCITITNNNIVVDGIGTFGHSATFAGKGIHMTGAGYCHIRNWIHVAYSDALTPSSSIGGDGLFGEHGEGNFFEHIQISKCSNGVNMAEEFSVNTFIDASCSTNYRALFFNGTYTANAGPTASSGGNTFMRFKAVNGNGPTAVLFQNKPLNGGPGNNLFMHCDWDEGGGENAVTIESTSFGNVFINQNFAPNTTFTDNGYNNVFLPAPTGGVIAGYGAGDQIIPSQQSATFSSAGTLITGVGKSRLPFAYNAEIIGVVASVGTAPTGVNLILDVNLNGVTIFTTLANRPKVVVGAFSTASMPTPDVTAVTAGDYLTVDVDQVGSGVAGADLVVQVLYRSLS